MLTDSQTPLTFELILECLSAVEADPSDNDKWDVATQNSAQWLASRFESDGGLVGDDSGTGHLYCPKGCRAAPGGTEAEDIAWEKWRDLAAFQIRMFSYKARGPIERWRAAWEQCVTQCVDCAVGYATAEASTTQRWLPLKYDDGSLRKFVTGFDRICSTMCKERLDKRGFLAHDESNDIEFAPTLTDLGLPLLANVLARPRALTSDPIIRKALVHAAARMPPQPMPALSNRPLPGLLVLAADPDPACAAWARLQTPLIDSECWHSGANETFGTVFRALLDAGHDPALPDALPQPQGAQLDVLFRALAFTIRSLSFKLFQDRHGDVKWKSIDETVGSIRHAVCGHLGDDVEHLPAVLESFVALLNKVGGDLWRDEKDGWAGVVIASLVDNPAFERLYDNLGDEAGPSSEELVGWMQIFLQTQLDAPEASFVGNLGQLIAILLERFQQIRFAPSQRCQAISTAVQLLSSVCGTVDLPSSRSKHDGGEATLPIAWPHALAVDSKVLDVHSGFLAEVAFGPRYQADEWIAGRAAARELVGGIAMRDVARVADGVRKLSDARGQVIHTAKSATDAEIEALKVSPARGFWTKVYAALAVDYKSPSVDGLAILLPRLSHCVLTDRLGTLSWLPPQHPQLANLKPACRTVNDTLRLIRDPIVACMQDLADSADAAQALPALLKFRGVAEGLIMFIGSPDEAVHKAALTVVRQWADCDSRPECFKALLEYAPKATMGGTLRVLQTVVRSATVLPDATGLARRLVRCMTDVLDVLCSPTSGLLREAAFVHKIGGGLVQLLWSEMCAAIAEIFSKTPQWAAFGRAEEMTDWMRDALIFAEHMLEQVWTFEAAASGGGMSNGGGPPGSPAKASEAAAKMVDSFGAPTESLLGWLRLTEPDLLEKAASVLVRMLERFARFKRPIKPSVLNKLEKYLRQSQAKKQGVGVILTEQQCANITESLARHPLYKGRFEKVLSDEDDDQEIRRQQKLEWSKVFGGKGEKTKQYDDEVQYVGTSSSTSKPKVAAPPLKLSVGGVAKAKHALPTRHSALTSNTLIGKMRQQQVAARHQLHAGKDATVRPSFGERPMKAGAVGGRAHPAGSSSEDSEDDEDDEGEKGLAGLAKAQKPRRVHKQKEEKRTIKRFDDPAHLQYQQVQAARAQRVAAERSEKLRMSPDFTALHRHILQWDYTHQGPAPPGAPTRFESVPNAFHHYDHYTQILEPLIMCELWQGITRAKEEVASGEKPVVPCEISGRASVDDFIEIYVTVKAGLMPDKTYFTESDLVLIRAGPRCAMAKVTGFSKKPDFFELGMRLHMGSDVHGVNGVLVPKTKWEALHLCSLSTTHREWAALRSIRYLNLGNDVLDAHLSVPEPVSETDVHQVMRAQAVNDPQARAILSSLATSGFSLIQGPPGTGKTSTIVGLVGTFMSRRSAVTANGPGSISQKILLCAPSNAAVDEIAKRLKDGVRNSRGELVIPRVVRIGIDAKVNLAVKDIFIDELVEAAITKTEGATTGSASNAASQLSNVRQQIRELRETRDAKQIEVSKVPTSAPFYRALHDDLTGIRKKIHQLSQQLDSARDQQAASKRSLDAATRRIRMQILTQADVVCATLSGSGHDYMSQAPFDFETVIIDEACQCVEPASLIPLRYNARQCIMVGDPLQLPPTVLSQAATKAGYDSSLFVRMQQGTPNAVHLLSIQYRMNPDISLFPSKQFYDSRLRDGAEMSVKTAQPWHTNSLFPPYAFFHARNGREERGRHHSLMNRGEAGVAVAIYRRLVHEYPEVDFDFRVGIITGYAAQVAELKRQFRAAFGVDRLVKIDINTVDGFQGQEKDIIILSCVRGGPEQEGIGFLKDTRRMNVALTRAKSSLFVIGDRHALKKNQHWGAMIQDASERGVISEVDPSTFTSAAPPRVVTAAPTARKKKAASPTKPALPEVAGPILTPAQLAAQSGIPGLGTAGGGARKRLASMIHETPNLTTADEEERQTKKLKGEDGEQVEPAWDAFAVHPSLNGAAARTSTNGRGRGGAGPKPEVTVAKATPVAEPKAMLSLAREPAANVRPAQTAPAGPKPVEGSSNGKPAARPAGRAALPAKPPPSLFIQKKRPVAPPPTGPRKPAQGDSRSVKQRLGDQVEQPRPPQGPSR